MAGIGQADEHLAAREAKGEYGLLNWGDWFGERTYNWGNCEYDLPWAALQQFARFGDERYFQVAEAAARHMADIDVVHAVNRNYLANDELRAWYDEIPAEPGCVYEHAIGHVGGYSKTWKQDYRTRHPGAYTWGDPRNLGHLWVKGLLYHHLLTGDPWTLDAAVRVGDHLVNTARQAGWDWHLPDGTHSGRGAGWPFRALTALAEPGDAEIRRVFQKNFACLTKVLRARNDPAVDRVDFSYLTREVPRILYFATSIVTI
jgi:hypothetical protein